MTSSQAHTLTTVLAAVATAVAPLIPGGFGATVAAWISTNPASFAGGVAALFGALHLVAPDTQAPTPPSAGPNSPNSN